MISVNAVLLGFHFLPLVAVLSFVTSSNSTCHPWLFPHQEKQEMEIVDNNMIFL